MVSQSHLGSMPSLIDSIGMASVRTIVSIERSRKSGLHGAKPKPQLPSTTEVTPCQLEMVQYGIPADLGVVVGVQIDEARGHDEPVGVDHPVRRALGAATDLGDPAVLDPEVAAEPRAPACRRRWCRP